jgi:hypothetical protein
MEHEKRPALGQDGSVLIIALLIMVLLTVVGLSVTRTTDTDIQIAKNDQFHKTAFFNADSGIYTTPKLISLCVDNAAEQTVANITYKVSANAFYRQVMGFDAYDGGTRDLEFSLAGFAVNVDVNRTGQQNLAGGGVEFASGAEGVGVGSGGGVAIFYDMDSLGNGPSNSESNVGAVYRKVVGVGGGL